MGKTPKELDAEIAAYLANPKLGDKKWEAEWASLLDEKHGKHRMPTVEELARAFAYVQREFVIRDGKVDMEQLSEGLAFGQRSSFDEADRQHAHDLLRSSPRATWTRATARADQLLLEQREPQRYPR